MGTAAREAVRFLTPEFAADRMVGVSTWRRTADQPMVTAATCRPVAIRTRPPVAIEWPPIAEGRPLTRVG